MLSTGLQAEGKSFQLELLRLLKEEFSRRKVFEVTCQFSVSTKTPVSEKLYQTVVIDEAGQVLESEVLMPLTLHDKDVRLALIGDHKQLPATVKHHS